MIATRPDVIISLTHLNHNLASVAMAYEAVVPHWKNVFAFTVVCLHWQNRIVSDIFNHCVRPLRAVMHHYTWFLTNL